MKAVLLIDEAQNLTREVLEQLRLLSNLETTNRKLLEIILVGQPELREILASRELRQLKQRISLRCRLTPLTYQESIEYIQHRIGIASGKLKADFYTGFLPGDSQIFKRNSQINQHCLRQDSSCRIRPASTENHREYRQERNQRPLRRR